MPWFAPQAVLFTLMMKLSNSVNGVQSSKIGVGLLHGSSSKLQLRSSEVFRYFIILALSAFQAEDRKHLSLIRATALGKRRFPYPQIFALRTVHGETGSPLHSKPPLPKSLPFELYTLPFPYPTLQMLHQLLGIYRYIHCTRYIVC